MSYISEIERFAHKQFTEELHEGIGFEFQGQWIIDPWMEASGRWELGTEQAFELYGMDNMLSFIEDASERLGLDEEKFYVTCLRYPGDTRNAFIHRMGKDKYEAKLTLGAYEVQHVHGTSKTLRDSIEHFPFFLESNTKEFMEGVKKSIESHDEYRKRNKYNVYYGYGPGFKEYDKNSPLNEPDGDPLETYEEAENFIAEYISGMYEDHPTLPCEYVIVEL